MLWSWGAGERGRSPAFAVPGSCPVVMIGDGGHTAAQFGSVHVAELCNVQIGAAGSGGVRTDPSIPVGSAPHVRRPASRAVYHPCSGSQLRVPPMSPAGEQIAGADRVPRGGTWRFFMCIVLSLCVHTSLAAAHLKR